MTAGSGAGSAPNGHLHGEVDGVSMGRQRVIEGALPNTADPRSGAGSQSGTCPLHDTLTAYPQLNALLTETVLTLPTIDSRLPW